MIIHDVQQGSDGWKALRAGRVTASCFAKVMAKIKTGEASERRNYRSQLIVERLTGKPLEGYVNDAMKDGTAREPLARMAYEAATGNIAREVGFITHDELMAGSSPDGLVDEDGGLEVKCPQPTAHIDYVTSRSICTVYAAQVQGNMWITGRQWWDVVSFNPDFPPRLQLAVYRVMRDDAYIEKLEADVRKFLAEVEADIAQLERFAA